MSASTADREEVVYQVAVPPKLEPVFVGEADVRGAHGGRGSGKTRTFAKMTAVMAHVFDQMGLKGIILCARQFQNSLEDSSLEEVKAAIRETPWLLPHFEIGEKFIRTKSGNIWYSFSGLDRNIDSLKSKFRILLAWVDEAETVIEEAWVKLIPTLREAVSELWVTWNPEREESATNKRFHTKLVEHGERVKIVEINHSDNPWFPEVLERQRMRDQQERPHSYGHIWEGEFLDALEGAYFVSHLTQARQENRIGEVEEDSLLPKRAYWDIGVSDATSIWIVQQRGDRLRFIDHYEAVGQDLSSHLNWLRSNGHSDAECVLPHDGAKRDAVTAIRFEDHIRNAGFSVRTVENQGKGAAMKRVEAARRLFNRFWFDEEKCAKGLKALGWYHEKQNQGGYGVGPEHDWASHSADAFGLAAVDYREPRASVKLDMSKIGAAV